MCMYIILTSTKATVTYLLQYSKHELKVLLYGFMQSLHDNEKIYIIYIYNTLNIIHNFTNNIIND